MLLQKVTFVLRLYENTRARKWFIETEPTGHPQREREREREQPRRTGDDTTVPLTAAVKKTTEESKCHIETV